MSATDFAVVARDALECHARHRRPCRRRDSSPQKQGLVAAKPIVTLYFRTASPLRIAPVATWPRDTNATDGTGVPMAKSVRDHDVVFEMRPDHRLGKCLADCIEHDVFLDRVRRRASINIGQRRFQR